MAPEFERRTFAAVGVGQGIQLIKNNIYLFGDDEVGTVVELDLQFNPTGWVGYLTVGGRDAISHPTGIAYRGEEPTFIGGLLGETAFLYQIDWEIFREDGNLDRALLKTIQDTAAIYGTRPEYVEFNEQWYVATGDYKISESESEVRLMDPEKLKAAHHTLESGVVRYRFFVSPFVQDLFWSDANGLLVLVQNLTEFVGWRLTFVDLPVAVSQGSGMGEALRRSLCVENDTELEGYSALPNGEEIFLDASSENNFSAGFQISNGGF